MCWVQCLRNGKAQWPIYHAPRRSIKSARFRSREVKQT